MYLNTQRTAVHTRVYSGGLKCSKSEYLDGLVAGEGGQQLCCSHKGLTLSDLSHLAGVGRTPDVRDTSQANREKPECHIHPHSRSQNDILFLYAV
jgi:hypothetical protein